MYSINKNFTIKLFFKSVFHCALIGYIENQQLTQNLLSIFN